MAKLWTLVDQDFLTHRFLFVKKQFFLVSTHLGLIHCEKPMIQQFPGVLYNKGATWPKNGHFRAQQEGSNLDQIQKYLFGVYWDQYQGFKTPAFWLNVMLFQKIAPP
jgi:hypothetical protein